MGPVLEMTAVRAALLAAALAIAGCTDKAAPAPAAIAPDPAVLAEGRRVLAEGGKPVISVTDRRLGLATFMVPLGVNSGVVTWANPEYQTIAMQKGVILATRGFVRDLMSAEVPDVDHLRLGTGGHRRVHYVLDGADQTLRLTYDCSLSVSNHETISILGLSYETRRVDEICAGPAGNLTNSYWFDASGAIRQSSQARAPGAENMTLQAIID